MRNHIIMMIGIMIAALLPEIAHAGIDAIVFNISGLGCTGSVFETGCSTDPSSGFFASISCKVMNAINSGIIPLYCNIIGNPGYVMAINAVVALYVTLWGLMAVAGMTQVTMGQAFIKMLKVMFVFGLVMNASFYFEFVYSFVMQAPQQIVRVMLESSGNGGESFFDHVDKKFGEMFNSTVKPEVTADDGSTYQAFDLRMVMLAAAAWKLIPGIGEYLFAFFFFTLFSWMLAYISIVVRYLLALVVLNFLLMLGPIFLPTILFERSKFLGDEWIKMLVSYMIQIVVVIGFVLMVEDTYAEFTDLIKTGINETILDEDYEYFGKDIGNDVTAVEKKYGITVATAEKYVVNNPNMSEQFATKEDFIKWFLFQLILMAIVSFLTLVFMKDYVPLIATALGGNLKFVSIFGDASTPNLMQHDKGDARTRGFGDDGSGNRAPTDSTKQGQNADQTAL